ncbi:uncharacterized protein LOC127747429 [Arachis duranensis]|uniref:Uncharacterized protein LOC127747429 n=1 Tax=Arachis duranensis TaxID=130453 RepID=A0A9C6TNH0_ARADU|nr:uncharacterized protein LOC127747429 [Arachis duranensis]
MLLLTPNDIRHKQFQTNRRKSFSVSSSQVGRIAADVEDVKRLHHILMLPASVLVLHTACFGFLSLSPPIRPYAISSWRCDFNLQVIPLPSGNFLLTEFIGSHASSQREHQMIEDSAE